MAGWTSTATNCRCTKERLKILVLIDEALQRYSEVLPLLWASANREEAVAAIRSLLHVDVIRAQAVLDLQWSRMTVDEHAHFRATGAAGSLGRARPTE